MSGVDNAKDSRHDFLLAVGVDLEIVDHPHGHAILHTSNGNRRKLADSPNDESIGPTQEQFNNSRIYQQRATGCFKDTSHGKGPSDNRARRDTTLVQTLMSKRSTRDRECEERKMSRAKPREQKV